jgi:hypothetical protein
MRCIVPHQQEGKPMEVKRWRNLSIAGIVAVLLMLIGSVAASAQVACPPNVSVDQKAVAPNEWSIDYAKTSPALSSATIFDGAPEEQASLKYDDQRTTKNEIIQTWELPASDHGYWIVCGYNGTTAQLRHKLPADVRACEVVLEKGVTFGDGSAIIKRASCGVAKAAH